MEETLRAQESPSGCFRVQVHTLDGTTLCEVSGDSKSTVQHLKTSIDRATGICSRHQRLLLGHCQLEDGDLLEQVFKGGSNSDVCSISLIRQRATNAEAAEWIDAVEKDWRALERAPMHICNDIDVLLACVAQDRRVIRHAKYLEWAPSEIIALIRRNPDVFELLATGWCHEGYYRTALWESAAWSRDADVVLAALDEKPDNFKFAGNSLKGDRAFVLTAVQRHGEVLAFASKALRDNFKVVHAAVTQEPKALRFASDALRGDRGILVAVARKDPDALRYALRWSKDKIGTLQASIGS